MRALPDCRVGDLIQRIEVHQAENVDGVHFQRLAIHYNYVGEMEGPDTLAVPEITMQTRKGVAASYLPALGGGYVKPQKSEVLLQHLKCCNNTSTGGGEGSCKPVSFSFSYHSKSCYKPLFHAVLRWSGFNML